MDKNEYRQKIEQLLASAEESSILLGVELAKTMQVDISDYLRGVALLLDREARTIKAKDILALTKKESVYFTHRETTTLPSAAALLINAVYVYFTNNNWTTLPDIFKGLRRAEKLHLRYNRLAYLPPSIFDLSRLTQLFINNNQLKSIPSSIGQLQNLEMLSLSANQLTTLPEEIKNLKNLRFFFIDDNPIDFRQLPKALLDRNQTPDVIVKALERLRQYKLKRK